MLQEAMDLLFNVPRDIQERIQMNLTYAELSLMSRASKRYPRICRQDNVIDPSHCLGWKFTEEDDDVNGKVPCATCTTISNEEVVGVLLNEVNSVTVDLRTAVGDGRMPSDAIKKALDAAMVAKRRLIRTEELLHDKYVLAKLQIKDLIAVLGNRIVITMKNLKDTHKKYKDLWTLPKGMDETVYFLNLHDWVVPATTDFTGYNQYDRDVLMVEASSRESINQTVKEGEYNVLILDDGNHSIMANAFEACRSLRSVTMPYTVTTIHAGAFRSCENLESVDMPKVTIVGKYAFQVCRTLKSVDMPLLTTVGEHAFAHCITLKSVDMPLLTTVGKYAFQMCRTLESVNMPKVRIVEEYAFRNCSNLKSVNMPLLKTVWKNAFVGCENLESVVMPLVTKDAFGKDAFERAPGRVK